MIPDCAIITYLATFGMKVIKNGTHFRYRPQNQLNQFTQHKTKI